MFAHNNEPPPPPTFPSLQPGDEPADPMFHALTYILCASTGRRDATDVGNIWELGNCLEKRQVHVQ